MTEPTPFLPASRAEAPHGALSAARKANAFRAASKAPATVRAYTSAWRAFGAWCRDRGLAALPAAPATLAAYLADRADPESGRPLKPVSLWQHAAAVAKAHKLAGLPRPALRRTTRYRSSPNSRSRRSISRCSAAFSSSSRSASCWARSAARSA